MTLLAGLNTTPILWRRLKSMHIAVQNILAMIEFKFRWFHLTPFDSLQLIPVDSIRCPSWIQMTVDSFIIRECNRIPTKMEDFYFHLGDGQERIATNIDEPVRREWNLYFPNFRIETEKYGVSFNFTENLPIRFPCGTHPLVDSGSIPLLFALKFTEFFSKSRHQIWNRITWPHDTCLVIRGLDTFVKIHAHEHQHDLTPIDEVCFLKYIFQEHERWTFPRV